MRHRQSRSGRVVDTHRVLGGHGREGRGSWVKPSTVDGVRGCCGSCRTSRGAVGGGGGRGDGGVGRSGRKGDTLRSMFT